MKPLIVDVESLFVSTLLCAQTNSKQIVGKWYDENKDAQIEMFQKGNMLFGKIVWLKEPNDAQGKPKLDKFNPDPAKRNKPILGLEIITGLEFVEGKWIKGKIYSPKEGQTAYCSVSLQNEKELSINVSKYLFSTTKVWRKQ